MDFSSWNMFWTSCFGSLATLIIFGNTFTILTFFRQRRRKRANFLLISLAVADLLVGLLPIPLYIKTMYVFTTAKASEWYVWNLIMTGADVFTGITSIYTLAAISLERMFAISWPLRHRTLDFRVYICAIVVPWIVATVFTVIVMLNVLRIITRKSMIFLTLLFLTTPLLAICVAYFVIWRKLRSSIGNQNRGVAREAQLAKTLFLITGSSLLTWLPFHTVNLLVKFNTSVRLYLFYKPAALIIIKLLQFSNSLVNVIIYPFRIPEFKNAIRQLFYCCVVPFQRSNTEGAPTTGTGSVISLLRFTNSHFSTKNLNQETSL